MAFRLRTTDRLFARFCRTGDARALGRVFDRTAGHLLHVAAWLAGNRHDAEDLLQRTFLTAIEDRASFAAERSVMPWLVGILTNHARNLQRERARRAALPAAADRVEDPGVRAADRELLATMARAREALAAPYAEVLELSLEQGLDANEIAARLGRPAGTVRTQLVRALELLRRRLPSGFVAGFAPTAVEPGALGAVKAPVLAAASGAAVIPGVATVAMTTGGALMAKKIVWAVPVIALLLGVGAYGVWPRSQEPSAPPQSSTATASLDAAKLPAASRPAATTGERVPDRELVAAAPAADDADPGFASLSAVVRWQHDGSPAKSVGLYVVPKLGSQLLRRCAITDAEGVAVLRHIAPGGYYLGGTHFEQTPDLDLAADQQQTVELEAKRASLVRGRVVDHDGAPVADASISVADSDWVLELGRSDAGGNFVVPLLEYCRLAASKPGHVTSYSRTVAPRPDKVHDIELVLRGKAGTVRGTVRDASGAGIPWATVLVGLRGGHVMPSSSPDIHLTMPNATRVLTGRDGEFDVADVMPGKTELRAWAVGFGPTQLAIEVRAGEVTETAVPLTAGCTVTGVVRDAAGQPVASAIVQFGEEFAVLRSAAVRAEADGRFRLTDLPAVNVRLSASKDTAKATTTLSLRAGTTTEWNPVLGKGRSITGTVLGPDDVPFAGVKVGTVHPNFQQVMNWFETDAAGRFELPNVGDKPAPLQVEKDGASLVETKKIAPDTKDVVIRVTARDLPTARLRGRIVDTLGRPIPGSVFLRRAHITNGDAQQLDETTGGFAFGPMPASRYEVSALAEGYGHVALGTIALEPAQERVLDDFVMQEPGAVELTVFDAAGKPAEAQHTGLRTEAGLHTQGCEIKRGKGKLGVLQPGRYFFECHLGRRQVARTEFDVKSGTTSQVELHASDAVQATIRFKDPGPENRDLSVEMVLRTADGRLAAFAGTHPENAEPLRQSIMLAIGSYRIKCTASDGRRVAGELTVRSLDERPELTIDLPRR